ncbi:hypothetical protein [Streptomyces sp900105755]|uniref:Uncharacterized protein n=1 Tax=Streptomyces sp. 900105755 TaxID=3154389 RepID=A0ABV1TYE3_9ACTN
MARISSWWSAAQPISFSPQYDSSMPLIIGGCINSASATTPYLAFPGSVADVHVYPRTLSATEVSALH